MRNTLISKIIASLAIIVIAAYICFPFANKYTALENYKEYIESIDDKKDTVLKLIAASTVTSAVLSAIPDDTTTPIADKLADFSEYFLIVLCVLFAEKYLLGVLPGCVFYFLLPVMFVLFIISIISESKAVLRQAIKILLISIAVVLVIPISVKASDSVYDTYKLSIDNTIAIAENISDDSTPTETAAEEDVNKNTEKEKGRFWSFLTNIPSTISETITETKNNITEKVSTVLSQFVEALAVMILTSCIIPILVLLVFMWFIKELTGFDLPSHAYSSYERHKAEKQMRREIRRNKGEKENEVTV